VSGDLRITPNGLTARDIAGITTFAIDGTTGGAVFKGTVQSGSLLTGGVVVEDENGQTVIDGEGIVGANSFIPGFVAKTADQVLTGEGTAGFEDITGLSFTNLEFDRDIPVLFFGMLYWTADVAQSNLMIRMSDGINTYPSDTTWFSPAPGVSDSFHSYLFNLFYVTSIPQGTTTLKVQGSRSTTDATITVLGLQTDSRSTFGYLKLGK